MAYTKHGGTSCPATVAPKPDKTRCNWFDDWLDCDTCGNDHQGYSSADGCVSFEIDVDGSCQFLIGKSLTDTKNKDHPWKGAYGNMNATWEVGNLCYWLMKEPDLCSMLNQLPDNGTIVGG